jgi:tyrosyl-tRNA synthetase
MDNSEKVKIVLTRGVEQIFPSAKDLEKLILGKKIRLYCGYDPTGSSLHLGHAITLMKLAQFQELGHEVIMLIGDFTGMIGDPTEKLSARKKLTREQVLENAKNYQAMASKIIKFDGPNPAKIRFNSEWSDKLSFRDLIELSSNFTVQQMMAREMFQERTKKGEPIFLHEFLYPLAQAYDSVAMDVDLEVGGNDQMFNMLCGRDLMKALKNKEKLVLTLKLLTDSSGKKMGKSEGNMVEMTTVPQDMYGKIMSWPDELIIPGLELLTKVPLGEIEKIAGQMAKNKINPRDAKARLAEEVTTLFHSKEAAQSAAKEFDRIFKDKKGPSQITKVVLKEKELPVTIIDTVTGVGLAETNSEARRLIEQGGVTIDGKKITDWNQKVKVKKGMKITAGKREIREIDID